MTFVSLRVNVPLLLAVEELSGDISVFDTLVPNNLLDNNSDINLDNYEMLKSGAIYEVIGTKMTDFASKQITDYVSSKILYKKGTSVRSVVIRIVDNENAAAINTALETATAQLPVIQPDVVQFVFTFILADGIIDTSDYSYEDGKLSWTMGVNIVKPVVSLSAFMGK
jgi:hypothetical protein